MSIIEAIVLGLIQGLSEFIPISSSGHLVIAQTLFSGASNHLFLEWINLGTFLALLVFYRQRIIGIAVGIIQNRNYRLARNIILTAVPAGIIGFIFADFIAGALFFNSAVTAVFTLAIIGIVMIVLERLPKASPVVSGEQLSSGRALTIGVAQIFALIPGVSRSGSTIVAGRLMGLKAAEAAEYSFLASLPIMFGVIVKLVLSNSDRQYFIDNAAMLTLSNVCAFISGLIAVSFFIRYLSNHGLAIFGWYRVGLASVLAAILLLQ